LRAGRSQVVRARWKARRPAERMSIPSEGLFPSAIWARHLTEWLRRRLPYFALLVILGWSVRLLLTSPVFEVQQVTVEGQQLLRAEEVVAAAGLYPQSIFTLDRQQIASAVERLPAVQKAEVRFRLPREVTIRVWEWPPAYAWKVGSQLILVSPAGTAMGATTREEGLLVVEDIDAKPVKVGDMLDLRALQTATKLRQVLPKELGVTPGYFEYAASDGIILPGYRGLRVIFGWEDDLERKVATLAAIMNALDREHRQATLIDLRYGDRPYIR